MHLDNPLIASQIVPAIEQRSVDTDLVARAEQAQQNTQAAQAPQAQQAVQAKQGGQTVNSVTGQQCWGWSCYYRGRYVGVGVGVNVGGLGINVNGYVDPRYAYLYGGNYGVYPGAGYVNYGGYQNNGNIAIGNRVGGGIYQWA